MTALQVSSAFTNEARELILAYSKETDRPCLDRIMERIVVHMTAYDWARRNERHENDHAPVWKYHAVRVWMRGLLKEVSALESRLTDATRVPAVQGADPHLTMPDLLSSRVYKQPAIDMLADLRFEAEKILSWTQRGRGRPRDHARSS